MRRIKIISILILVLCLCLSVFIYCKIYKRTRVRLTERYLWELVDIRNTVIIDLKDNRIVVGPGDIELWADYPWIYGFFIKDNKVGRFTVNIKTGEKWDNLPSFTDVAHYREYVTFFDVAEGRQYFNEYKVKRLLRACNPDRNPI